MSRLRHGAPQSSRELRAALARAQQRLARTRIDGMDWYWPAGECARSSYHASDDHVRLLAPFDPVVWDRGRFELFWGWAYRFEAYTPASRRKLGYYALPRLWRGEVIGWGNLAAKEKTLACELGYVAGRAPASRDFRRELEAEFARMRAFLRL